MWAWNGVEALWQDTRFGLRQLMRSPGFTLFAILTLALGIGANTAIFSIADAFIFKPVPFPDADRLVMLWKTSVKNANVRGGVAPADFLDLQQQVRTCSAVAAFAPACHLSARKSAPARRSTN